MNDIKMAELDELLFQAVSSWNWFIEHKLFDVWR